MAGIKPTGWVLHDSWPKPYGYHERIPGPLTVPAGAVLPNGTKYEYDERGPTGETTRKDAWTHGSTTLPSTTLFPHGIQLPGHKDSWVDDAFSEEGRSQFWAKYEVSWVGVVVGVVLWLILALLIYLCIYHVSDLWTLRNDASKAAMYERADEAKRAKLRGDGDAYTKAEFVADWIDGDGGERITSTMGYATLGMGVANIGFGLLVIMLWTFFPPLLTGDRGDLQDSLLPKHVLYRR
jgi:hypothetical protein